MVYWVRSIEKTIEVGKLYEGIKALKEGTSRRGKILHKNAKHDYIRKLR